MPNQTSSSTGVPKPAEAEKLDPLPPIVNPPIPIHPVPVSGTVALSPASPSTTVNPPASGVSVTVPNASGTVTFSLVVTDNLGAESAPAFATVSIQSPPVAVLAASPATVPEGGAIELSGTGSSSSGSIASYKFSLVPAPVVG